MKAYAAQPAARRQMNFPITRRLLYVLAIVGALKFFADTFRFDPVTISSVLIRTSGSTDGRKRNVASPLLLHDTAPLPWTLTDSSCGKHARDPMVRYTLPDSHPTAAIGKQIFAENYTCTTYLERYKAYDEERLPMQSYLSAYFQSMSYPGSYEDAIAATEKLVEANRNARKHAEWDVDIKMCRSAREHSVRQALVLRSYENYTWVSKTDPYLGNFKANSPTNSHTMMSSTSAL